MQRYIQLGMQPLANALRAPGTNARDEFRAPLAVQACSVCKLSQLTHVVDREVMYTSYAYRSGVSPSWRAHCAKLAAEYARDGAFVVDIASNDGTLIRNFEKRGCQVLGVEPSETFRTEAYPKLTQWWGVNLVERMNLVNAADIIVAQNVLGHVDDVNDFLRAVALALKPNGAALVEVPYILTSLFDNLAFDTIYHEHLSYWSVTALQRAAADAGLVLCDLQHLPIHGGSIRATLAKAGKPSEAVTRALVEELHDLNRSAYMRFSSRVTRAIARINEELLCQTPYAGFGAAAKTTVMLGCLDPRAHPYVVYDENPAKWGSWVPGTRIPIEAPPADDWSQMPGPMVNFVWTQPDIVGRLRGKGYDGAIYTPLPRGAWSEL